MSKKGRGLHGPSGPGDTVGLERTRMSEEKLEHRVNHIGIDRADAEGRLQDGNGWSYQPPKSRLSSGDQSAAEWKPPDGWRSGADNLAGRGLDTGSAPFA